MLRTKLGFMCWLVEFGCCGKVEFIHSSRMFGVALQLLAWRFGWRGASVVGVALASVVGEAPAIAADSANNSNFKFKG